MTDSSDILICAEFKQILGPSIIFTIPRQPRIQTKQVKETEDVLNNLTMKAMSMKFSFDDNQNKQLSYNDDSYIVMEFDDIKRYTSLWYFTYLPDLSARGFSRRIGVGYVTPFKEKLMRHVDCISNAFQQALLCLKYPLCAIYRFEAVQYAGILDGSIQQIVDKIEIIEEDDLLKKDLCKLVNNYSEQSLRQLIEQMIDLKYFLLNKHSLLHMKDVPLFFQLFQTEEITDLVNQQEFATIQYSVNFLKAEKQLQPKIYIIPDNYPYKIITVAPHELRIQKRQELRTIDQLVGSAFFNYFTNLLTLAFNYFSQTIADLEFSEIMTQYNTQAMVQNKQLKGVWFGQKFFLPCELDEAFALSYTFQPHHRYRELFIAVENQSLKQYVKEESNYQVYDWNGEAVLSVQLPYGQITDKFYIAYYSMFPYLPALQPSASNLIQAMPQYGHLLHYFVEQYNEKLVKTLITQLLSGFQIVILTNERAFGLVMQQVLDPFIISHNFQENRSLMDQFSETVEMNDIIHQMTILIYSDEQESKVNNLFSKISKENATCAWFQLDKKQVMFSGNISNCSIVDDLLANKETPSVFCVTRRLECCLRKYVLESLYNDKVKKVYKVGEDHLISDRFAAIVNGEEKLVYQIQLKKKVEQFKINKDFQSGLNESGLYIIQLQNGQVDVTTK